MKARVYKTIECRHPDQFDSSCVRVNETHYLCVETPEGRMHLTNDRYYYEDTVEDGKIEPENEWKHSGSCDGTCEETCEISDDEYNLALEEAARDAAMRCPDPEYWNAISGLQSLSLTQPLEPEEPDDEYDEEDFDDMDDD